jgi:septal ring factor EnvC (AmiA/AmiB activator)
MMGDGDALHDRRASGDYGPAADRQAAAELATMVVSLRTDLAAVRRELARARKDAEALQRTVDDLSAELAKLRGVSVDPTDDLPW